MTPVGISPNGTFTVESVFESYRWFLREGLLAQPLGDADLQDLIGIALLDEVLDEIGRVPES
jgi:hypothetical protein